MHSILFAINRVQPEAGDKYDKWWKLVTTRLNPVPTNTNILELSPGCWLIPAESGLHFLAEGIVEAKKAGLQCSVLFLDEEPKVHQIMPPSPDATKAP